MLLLQHNFPFRAIVRSSETESARQSSAALPRDGLRVANTRKTIARHTPPRLGWYTRLDSFFFFISLFPFFSALVQSFVPPRDLNIAFMLHRFTRRCLLRKAKVFITWKFIAHPLNRDEAKNSSLNWSCGDRDDVWLSLPCIRVARFIRKKLLRPQTLLKLASHTSGKRNPWEIYGLRWSRGEQNAIHLATEESRKRD